GRGPVPARVGRVDLKGLKLLEGSTPDSAVVFGARLASVTLEDGQWRIRFEPTSGGVLTHSKPLESIGRAAAPRTTPPAARPARPLVAALVAGWGLTAPQVGDAGTPIEVEPEQLARRLDLVGRTILVDDRIRFVRPHPGKGFDEIDLARTDIPCMLPA